MEYKSERDKSDKLVRLAGVSISIFAGLLIFSVGLIIFQKDNFKIAQVQKFTNDRDPLLMQLFGGICMLYGIWRVYRGYANYKNS